MQLIQEKRISTIVRLSRQAFGRYKLQIIILIILGILSGFLEGIGINALIPFFSFIVGDIGGGNDVISQTIEKFFSFLHIDFNLKYLLIFICLLFVLKAVVLLFCTYIRVKITTDYENQTRNELFNKTFKANWPYLIKQKVGYLETVLMKDVEYGALLLQQISSGIMIITGLIIYVLVAINISLPITLITLVLGAVVFLIFKPLIYKTRVVASKISELNKIIAHYVNESVIGIKTIKAMQAGGQVIKKAAEHFNELKDNKIKAALYKSVTGVFLQPVVLIFICLVFVFSYKSPEFNFAALAAIIYLIQRIFQYIEQLQASLQRINESYPFLRSSLNYESDIVKYKEANVGVKPFEFHRGLQFNQVSFNYNSTNKVLSQVSFAVDKNEMVGLIGPSGAGKTTLVDLILRLFKPQAGRILLDGVEAFEIDLKDWRKKIGYVSQDIFLINGTVAENIRFYNNALTDEEVATAAQMANIYDFIQLCPDKFETIVGERGVLFSAGQRQRIVIARILAQKPELLILDEATSALDNESEAKIQKVIENLKGKITVFVIAHRLSTVIKTDRLLVLKEGRIIEQASPEELLKNKESYFYKVYNLRK